MIYLDTHAVVWLYAGEVKRFEKKGLDLMESEQIYISPIIQLELQYLKEIKRLKVEPSLIIENLAVTIGLKMCEVSFASIISEAVQYKWTRDPFDRIVVASAAVSNSPLLTKDESIIKSYPKAFWG